MLFGKQFGGSVTDSLRKRYESSSHWNGGKFHNLEETNLGIGLTEVPRILRDTFRGRRDRMPSKPLELAGFDHSQFPADSTDARFIWYGHSAVLLRLAGKNLLIDPMLGPNASPIAPFPTKRFSKDTLDLIDDIPEIDLMVLTHDHYDHLDLASIRKLMGKTKQYFTALGVKRHLVHWGVAPELITEFDWWEENAFDQIRITFTPTRHFSGRGISDRQKSLWGGWVFATPAERIWFSGDGGYGNHFAEVGKRLGPFDLAFMECGQYSKYWSTIHLFPEESVQAAIDAQAEVILPVHWGGFALAQHSWTDPAERFLQEALKKNRTFMLPQLGRSYTLQDEAIAPWWRDY